MTQEPTFEDIQRAAARIKGSVHRTPVMTSHTFDALTGAICFFKCENFQRAGAFKFRGASNAVLSLSDEEAAHGVATHSSGNHAQALALAARLRGIPAHIVMPETAPAVKKEAVAGYGGRITFCRATLESREETLNRVVAATGAHVVHPFNDARVIAGQGTAALELLDEIPDLDIIVAPVGGGGLLSGISIAAFGVTVYGAEPQLVDDAFRSLRDGKLYSPTNQSSVADGLLTAMSELTFSIIKKRVAGIITVGEDEIIAAMKYVWERMKIVIEPSSAVAVAAVMSGRLPSQGKKIGVILSGGNVDLTNYFGQLTNK